jgi:hypothetical protein
VDREVNASLFFSASITINVPVVYIVRYVVVKYFSHSELAERISDPATLPPLKDQPLAFIHLE